MWILILAPYRPSPFLLPLSVSLSGNTKHRFACYQEDFHMELLKAKLVFSTIFLVTVLATKSARRECIDESHA